MIAPGFDYARPQSLGEALGLLDRPGALALAGGQSLLPLLADRSVTADLLVDIGRLPELRRVALEEGRLVIGAGATLAAVLASEAAASVPLLPEVLRSVGSAAIRNRGTLVGNLVRASPNSELPVAAAALDATFVLRSTGGEREVPASAFFLGPHRTVLASGELVTEIRIALPATAHVAGGFAEVAARAGAPPLSCVAAVLVADDEGRVQQARIAAGGITGVPVRWSAAEAALAGRPVSSAILTLQRCREPGVAPSPDLPGSDYARDVLPVLARRALAAAIARLAPKSKGEANP